MAEPDNKAVIDATIQSRVKKSPESSIPILMWLVQGQGLIAPYWSPRRDQDLRNFWKKVDHIAGAVYALSSRMTTIPFRVEPRDRNIASYQRIADETFAMLRDGSEFGGGWSRFYSPFIQDLLTTDNGAFGEIIAPGDPSGPYIGRPLGIAHLDSGRCTRTGNAEFPVIYEDPRTGRHKLHYTRCFYLSQMPSPDAELNGVGFCAISRCLNIAQNFLDIMTYKQEKLGSRPMRGILTTTGGLDPEDVQAALALVNESMDNQNLDRFSKLALIGDRNIKEASLELTDLAGIPDGFDEKDSMTLGMAAVALAFGVDARELWPAMSVGATKADALISHLKARGKAIGEILTQTEQILNQKVVPSSVKVVFDFQDDAQDRQVAEIRKIRGEGRVINYNSGAIDERTMREDMLEAGEITEAQFIRLELDDGRLQDGTDILTLFYNPDYRIYLNLGVPDPTNVDVNDAETMIQAIDEQRAVLMKQLANRPRPTVKKVLQESIAALSKLKSDYKGEQIEEQMQEEEPEEGDETTGDDEQSEAEENENEPLTVEA
ncbi:MAG: hypothetical protein DRJ03_01625 [Chloroflexi bacterium]|nr:MAG: hypothetical protein DRJ03_01625 [Chloroflexota bacterium]